MKPLVGSALLIFLVCAAPVVVLAIDRPNVLFIAVDDLRPELGCYGEEVIQSPHIDRLAKSGVVFDRAYCQQAVCNPSRVSLLTGLRPDTARVWDLVTQFRDTVPDAVTLPQFFKQNGYRTVGMGKIFHNPFPDPVSWSIPEQPRPTGHAWYSDATLERLAQRREAAKRAGMTAREIGNRIRGPATEIEEVADNRRFDGALADLAIEHLGQLATGEEPFFLGVGFILPHLPWTPPKKYWDLYDPEQIPLAANPFLPHGAPAVAFGDRSMGGMYELRDCEDFNDAPSPFEGSLSPAEQQHLKHGYYAAISFIDRQVGRLLDELERFGLDENTIVVLWGDHGWKLGEHNGWCKQTNYEVDTRVPLIIRGPGAAANGRRTKALVELVDLYPTLCDLAGLPVPDEVEGLSLAPLLEDPTVSVKPAAFSQFPRRHEGRRYMGYTIRTDRYRYVEWVNQATGQTTNVELYDEQTDPQENENLADQTDQKLPRQQLSAALWSGFEQPTVTQSPRTTEAESEADEQQQAAVTADRPNILFLMADDWSWPHAGALGDRVIKTPTFDRLTREGVLFENAFISAPSCTPSRFAVATGQYHWRLEEGVNLGGSLSADVDVYPELLQEAGYKIGHSRKGARPSEHKYRNRDPFGPKFENFEAFFADREPGEPFCFWYGAGEPHRPFIYETGIEAGLQPDDVEVPQALPDHEIVRTDICDYYERVQQFDTDSGRILAALEAAGELENTIVVMTGDNGMAFPRCKATLYDTGTRVPLVIRWGTRTPPGRSVSDFVSLCDLAPTFLEAVGLEVPLAMTGRSLIPQLLTEQSGQIDPSRKYILTGMERHVFPYPSRAIRTKDFLYVRNFHPENWPTGRGDGPAPQYDFSYRHWPSGAEAFSFNVDPSPTKQFLWNHRKDPQWQMFADWSFGPRPEEELFDLREDPGQINNVAGERRYRRAQQELRSLLDSKLLASRDPRMEFPDYQVRDVRGWTVLVSRQLLNDQPNATGIALGLLDDQLHEVATRMPEFAVNYLRTVPIWFSPKPADRRPTAEYHPAAGWLRDNDRKPELAKCVEFTNTSIFPKEVIRMPVLVLHELAHAYHEQVLDFENAEVKAVYQRAMDDKRYDAVLRGNGKIERAYAATNEKEYFAEMSEAYFGRNDFYPFDRNELREHDPLMEQLLDRIWAAPGGKLEKNSQSSAGN